MLQNSCKLRCAELLSSRLCRYSTHSWLGLSVLALLTLQYLLGLGAYIWPKLPIAHRQALGPLHIYLGKAIFVAGLCTMAVGIQEVRIHMAG